MAVSKSNRRRGPAQGPKSGYRFLEVVLDSINDGPLMEALKPPAATGRPAYPARAMLRAVLSKFILSHRYNLETLERLRASPRFRQICGFLNRVPSESTFSRFTTRLAQHRALLDDCMVAIVEALRQELPDLGETVALDSTNVDSFANPNRKVVKDQEARWGFKHSARAKEGGTEYCFGFKLHLLADANYGIPLNYRIAPANVNDSIFLPGLLEDNRRIFDQLETRYVLADRGYDAESNHRAVLAHGAVPIIHIRKPTADDGLYDGVYDKSGAPTCMGALPMQFTGTDPETGRHLFQCPEGGCHLKAKSSGAVLYCDSELWEDPMNNLRVLGTVWRGSDEWTGHYKKRMTIERFFRSDKHSRGLEGHRYRGLLKVQLLNSLSLLTYVATVLARIKVGDRKHLRKMRVKVA